MGCATVILVVVRFVISCGIDVWAKTYMLMFTADALFSPLTAKSCAEHNYLPLLRNTPRKYRSLCWLPILDPFSKFVIIWSNFLMVFDLTYTAFFLPISVGFKTDMIDLNTNYDTPVVFMLVVDVLAGED